MNLCILQDDNTPANRAAVVQEFKQNWGIRSLSCPADSPDLNPIEHAWDYLGRRVQTHGQSANVQQLVDWLR
jgi:transposase